MPRFNIYIAMAIAAAITISLGGTYLYIYNQGKDAEIQKQEKALNELKERTDDIQDRALTNPNARDELRKYARPD